MRKLIPMLLLCALAVGMAGCDGGFVLGGQVITVRVYQNSPLATTQPADTNAPNHNESHVTITNDDGGTSFMGPAANPTATTQPSQK